MGCLHEFDICSHLTCFPCLDINVVTSAHFIVHPCKGGVGTLYCAPGGSTSKLHVASYKPTNQSPAHYRKARVSNSRTRSIKTSGVSNSRRPTSVNMTNIRLHRNARLNCLVSPNLVTEGRNRHLPPVPAVPSLPHLMPHSIYSRPSDPSGSQPSSCLSLYDPGRDQAHLLLPCAATLSPSDPRTHPHEPLPPTASPA